MMTDASDSVERPGYLHLAALHRYNILDSGPDATYDHIVDLACDLFEVKMGVLSFVDVNREWIKARRNFPWTEIPLNQSFGLHAVQSDDVTVIEDTRESTAFADSPFVTAPPRIRFYAAAPLTTPRGYRIGTLAVMDSSPATPAPSTSRHLATLADLVMEKLEQGRTESISAHRSTPNIAVLDEDGTILQVNDAWTSFALSNSIDDLSTIQPGRNYLDACLPTDEEPSQHSGRKAREGIQAVLDQRRETFEMTYPCHTPTEKRWFRMNVTSFLPPGLPARAVVSHTDVTPEEKQQLDARLLQAAVDETNDVVVITEASPLSYPGPRITYVNPAFTTVTGYEPEEAIGKTPRLLHGPDTEPWVLERMREQLSREEPFEGEAINYRKDGTPYVNRWSVAPVRNDDGELTHWVSVQQDVTRERQIKRQLLRAQEEERRRIARRMHDEMGGLLASMQMMVGSVDGGTDATDRAAPPIKELKSLTTELASVVRTLTEQLHSRVLDDYGLSGALTRLVTAVKAEAELPIDLTNEIGDETRLPPTIEKVAFRGVQKALRTVHEQPRTSRIDVEVGTSDQRLKIRVTGHNARLVFEADPDQKHHDDLFELKHRIEQLNGSLDVSTDRGLQIDMTLPVTFLPPPLG